MSVLNSDCRNNSTGIAIVSSIIIGIIAAFLRITAVITLTPAFLWVVFGIVVVYLAVALATASLVRQRCSCDGICTTLSVFLTGILGTILFALILLAIEFVATSVIGAIVTGLLVFFFFLTVTTAASLVRCIINCES